MRVRLATLSDLSAIVALGAAWHERGSTYDGIPYNAVIARRTVKRCMQDADARVWVAVRGDDVVGFLIGEIGQMPFSHFMSATDLAFVADAGGDELVAAFVHWCELRKVARIDMGVSASGPSPVIGRFFRRNGFSEAGGLYYRAIHNEQNSREVA